MTCDLAFAKPIIKNITIPPVKVRMPMSTQKTKETSSPPGFFFSHSHTTLTIFTKLQNLTS
ncbi:MAG: hypothetical protein D6714_08825 [Bacteroidetes bacterium]|nr:MAG: hypothetical protein D6714_08825 [Bacteroidota bacterium]